MKKIIPILALFFMALPPATGQAASLVHDATLSAAVTSSGVNCRPEVGYVSVSVDFSSGAVGTMYLERKFGGSGVTGTPDWENVATYTSDSGGQTMEHHGAPGWLYRWRASMSSGTVYGLLTQSYEDRLK